MAARTVLTAALAAFACAASASAQEPGLRELVRRLGHEDRRTEAHAELRRLGAAALPSLIEALGDEAAPRVEVLELLDRMGPTAAPALESAVDLVKTSSPDELQIAAARTVATLVPYGEPETKTAAHEALLAAFMGGPGRARVGGNRGAMLLAFARLLHRMEIDLDLPPDKLAGYLESDSPFHRELAAERIAQRGTADQATELRTALTAEHPSTISGSWKTAGGSGGFRTRRDHSAAIRLAAARALVKVAGDRAVGAPGHSWLLHHGESAEKLAAARTIGRYGILDEDRDGIAGSLAKALDHDTEIVLEILPAIGLVGNVDVFTRAKLEKLAQSDDSQTAARAAAVLRQLDR